jgi:protein-S-isoprenylcysteine O-methyltransferase Ste14
VTHDNAPAYGLWSLVLINSAVFIFFAFSFLKPQTRRDWRSFSAFSAFLMALFTEMYGFPLTIYLLSGWLQSKYPDVDWFSHDARHPFEMIFGWKGNPHFGPFHLLSFAFIGGGFLAISAGWRVLYEAQRRMCSPLPGSIPTSGTRNMSASSGDVQLPLAMADMLTPVLVFMYVRLARIEERESLREFGGEYCAYMVRVPGFIPRLGSRGDQAPA